MVEVRSDPVSDDPVRPDEPAGHLPAGHGLPGLPQEHHSRIPLLHRVAAVPLRALLRGVLHYRIEEGKGRQGPKEEGRVNHRISATLI